MRFVLMILILVSVYAEYALAQTVNGSVIRLVPSTLSATCNPGDLRTDANASYKLKQCGVGNTWSEISGNSDAVSLQGNAVSTATPNDADVLTWNQLASQWEPVAPSPGFLNPMTTSQDLIVGGVGGSPGRLGIGVLNSVLLNSGGSASWAKILDANIDTAAAIAYSKLNLAGSIVNADISGSAAIVDSKLATISTAGKVSNSATTATSANTNSAIVARDGSGNFSAGTITASLSGNASTSSAFAADPSDCASDRYATTIAANGNLTCAQVTNAGLAGSIAASKLIGTDIATVGTITSGTWNGTVIGSQYGGTGQNMSASTGLVKVASGTFSAATLVNADVSASAGISLSKLAALGTGIIPYTDGSGFLVSTNAAAYDSTNKGITVTGDSSFHKVQSATDSTSSGTFAYDQTSSRAILAVKQSSTNQGANLAIFTDDVAGSNANGTGSINITTGSKTAGTGSSGSMTLTLGTSVAGSRGRLSFADGSEVNSPGAVWTISGNSGAGHWVYPSDSRNFIANPDANLQPTATTPNGWAIYADAAGTAPVDCNGGSPSTALTRNTSSPIGLNQDFRWTKSANNRQGEGFSYDFTIDKTDQAKVMKIGFDYQVASGTFVAGSSGVDSDMEVFIYDVTNGALIQPSTYKLFSSTTSPPASFDSTFQTAGNSTSYRLCVHTATSSASAYTLAFRNFEVKRAKYSYGTPVTDLIPFTVTSSWTSNVTWQGWYSRHGDKLDADYYGTITGAVTAAGLTVNLPSGLNLDTSKVGTNFSGSSDRNFFGAVQILRNLSEVYGTGRVSFSGTTNTLFAFSLKTTSTSAGTPISGNNVITNTSPATWASGDYVHIHVTNIPIVGWSSSVQMSTDGPQTAVAMHANTTSARTINNTQPTIVFENVDFDTLGNAYDNTTGIYTVRVPGFYKITAMTRATSVSQAAGNEMTNIVVINGVSYCQAGDWRQQATATISVSNGGSCLAQLKAGDQVKITVYSDTSTTLLTSLAIGNYFSIERLGDNRTLGATDTVTGTWTSTNTTALTTGVFSQVTYASTIRDSHLAMNLGTGNWTAPISGLYLACGNIFIVPSSSTSALPDISITIGSNTFFARGPSPAAGGIATVSRCAQGPMQAGQTANMAARCTWTGGTCALNTALTSHDFSITRIGNY